MQHERRIASWLPAPARVPFSLWERLVRFYKPVRRELIGVLVLSLVLASIGPFCGPLLFLFVFLGASVALLGLATCSMIASADVQEKSREDDLSDFGDGLSRISVTIQLFTGGFGYGADRGILTLVGDWLIFEGERTSFSLAPHDVTSCVDKSNEGGLHAACLDLAGLPGPIRIRLIGQGWKDNPSNLMAGWVHRQVDCPSTSILPPLERLPDAGKTRIPWRDALPGLERKKRWDPLTVLPVIVMVSVKAVMHERSIAVSLGVSVFLLALAILAAVCDIWQRTRAFQALARTKQAVEAEAKSRAGLQPGQAVFQVSAAVPDALSAPQSSL